MMMMMMMLMMVVVVVVSISLSSMHDTASDFCLQEQEEIENPEEAFLSFAERQKARQPGSMG